jgi:hypothetical protein
MKVNDETIKKSIAKFEKIFAKGNMVGAVCFGNKFVSKNLPEKSIRIKEDIKRLKVFKL